MALAPLPSAAEAGEALAETAEARELLETEGRPAIGMDADPAPYLAKLGIAEVVLPPAEILALVRLCSAAVAGRRALARHGDRWPLLERLASALPDLESLVTLIEPHILPSGEIADTASPELRRLRRRSAELTARVREILEGMLRKAGAESFLSDQFVTERGGRFVLPVRSGSSAARKGIVHGVSSSGATVFLEPMETVEMNNELVEARDKEAAEVERILADWTSRLSSRSEELEAASRLLARLDFALARGQLARQHRAVRPLLDCPAGLRVTNARHPALEEASSRRGGSVVPLTLHLDPGEATLVISGPNAGGKTVALKTVGLLAAMAYSGLHTPADELDLPPLRQILVDIGDRQSIEASLSTFSAHIKNIAAMLGELDAPALVLLDEVGTGTDPAEGVSLAMSLLEHLMGRGAITIVTTHHGALKAWAYSTPGVANAAVEFDEENLRPTYRLLMGVAGASSGLSIASRLGMEASVIEEARRKLSPATVEAEGHLRRLRELLAQAERDREEAGRLRQVLDAERRTLREGAEAAEARRKEEFARISASVLEELQRKSAALLAQVGDRRERLRLEKEKLRREAELKREIASQMQNMGIGVAHPASGLGAVRELGAGDKVLVSSLGREGIVEEADAQSALVRIGSARVRVRLTDCLEPAVEETGLPLQSLPPGVTADVTLREEIPGEIMLIGMTVEEALESLDKYLDDAFLSGRREVRVIHGHGTGRLRSAVRQFLSRHPHVESHRPGSPLEGGTGATVARLRS